MSSKNTKTRTYSVIVISDATSTSKTFSVSAKLVRRGIIAALAFFILFGIMVFHYLTISLDKQKMKRLVQEKQADDKKLAELNSTVNILNQKFNEMNLLSKKLLVVLGMTTPGALAEVGLGGPPVVQEDIATDQAQLPDNVRALPANRTLKPTPRQLVENATNLETTFREALSFSNIQNQRYAATPSLAPTRGYLSSLFAYRTNPFTQMREFHSGVDISTQPGNKVIAPADGTVLVAEVQTGFGKTIVIDHNFGYQSRYAHLSGYNVRVGQKVKRRDVIGFVGSTGRSTAPHLHYEVHYLGNAVNPIYFILDWSNQ